MFTKIQRPSGSLQGYVKINPVWVEKVIGPAHGYRDEKISKEWNISVDDVPLSLYYRYSDPKLHVAGASTAVISKVEHLLGVRDDTAC